VGCLSGGPACSSYVAVTAARKFPSSRIAICASVRFEQLGQDLQTGNLASAQADFAALQKDGLHKASSPQSSNPIAQALQQFSIDLQSGKLTAEQGDYTMLQPDFPASQVQHPHHHHHHSGGGHLDNGISSVLSQLGQDLQSGDLAGAQKAYNTLRRDLQQYAMASGALNSVGASSVNTSA
jgi:hypothetical protein